ncbi:MAG: phosphoribosylglycinamide formyltransferase [Gammaproteobacteria bacterium]|nr:phosphoribosylglycinamide formyltransferase [Gammaproteobacteria bacterium]
MLKIGVLASHRGSNLQSVIDACGSGELKSTVSVVISNNSHAPALDRARQASISAVHLSSRTEGNEGNLDQAICSTLISHHVDLVLTLGYMKKLGQQTLSAYKNRILNIHPSLLPKFGGKGMFGSRVHEAVLAAGETRSGASVHLLDAEYDTGPVIAQSAIFIEENETLESLGEKVLAIEHKLLVQTLIGISEGRILLP